MAITDKDLMALAALSETDARAVRHLPKGIGQAALVRLSGLKLAKQHGSRTGDWYIRTAEGSGVLRNHSGRLEILRRAGKLNAAQLAEIAPFTSLPG
jgi:hypothetical protein